MVGKVLKSSQGICHDLFRAGGAAEEEEGEEKPEEEEGDKKVEVVIYNILKIFFMLTF